MARTGARFNGGGSLRRERALLGVEAVDEHPVGAEIRCERETLGGIQVDPVRVRLLLSGGGGALAFVVANRRCGLELAVGPDP